VRGHEGDIVLDSGCGTAASTVMLAEGHPEALVIGVDKSADRLARQPLGALPPNLLLLRADLQDFWRLAQASGWRITRHCLFYPNPWPKAAQLTRRWHAHPVFPALLALGGLLELRSNWRLYLDEFAAALAIVGIPARIEPVGADGTPVSPFERKYLASGQQCWCLRARLAIETDGALRNALSSSVAAVPGGRPRRSAGAASE
jgi:tRNA G46 methylase TrmB